MQVLIVSRIIDDLDMPESITVSAHVDPERAATAVKKISSDSKPGYGVVEVIELDLTGMEQAMLDELRAAVG